jgi:hypothetical protein
MAPTPFGAAARRRILAPALACLVAVALAQAPNEGAAPGTLPPPLATPDLTPRALEADELDPTTLARMALRYQLDQVALEALGATRAPALILGVALQGQTVFLEGYGSRAPSGPPVALDEPLWLGALGHTLAAVVEARTGAAPDEDALQAQVFDPLGMTGATARVGVDAAYDAATVPPHGLRRGVLEALGATTVPATPDATAAPADRVRASALDLMAFAEALTDPDPPAPLAAGVRDALFAEGPRDHPAMPARTPGFAASVLAGHPLLRQDGDPPGARASLIVLPQFSLALFVYLNADAPPGGDPLIAASGARDAPAALLEAVLASLLGDARDAAAPERPWPAVTAATNPPAPGDYRTLRHATADAGRALAALQPIYALEARDGAVHLTPPPSVAEPLTFVRAQDGVWRSTRDGAPLVAARGDQERPRLLLHLGSTVALERVLPLERRDVALASWAVAVAAAVVVLFSWPLGALLRWRRREPRTWDRSSQGGLGRALRGLRVHARINAALTLALATGVGTLTARAMATGDAPIVAALPWLHAAAVPLALLLPIALLRTLLAAVAHPQAGWRWAWHALATLAFVAAWLQGVVWHLWSPAAIAARWLG